MVCPDGNGFKSYAGAFLPKVAGFGPAGEDGVYKEDVAAILGAAVRPGDGAVDSAGNPPGLFLHSLVPGRWQTDS